MTELGTTLDPASPAFNRQEDAVVEAKSGRRRRVATWLGRRGDDVARRVLRGLYLRRGVPYMTRGELERAFAMLRVYTDPEVLADPDRLLAPPSRLPHVTSRWRKPVRGGMLSERRARGAFGIAGGLDGAPGRNVVVRDGVETELPGRTELDLRSGDVLRVETPGGGGYGRRDP